jgi:hypothetical protein
MCYYFVQFFCKILNPGLFPSHADVPPHPTQLHCHPRLAVCLYVCMSVCLSSESSVKRTKYSKPSLIRLQLIRIEI